MAEFRMDDEDPILPLRISHNSEQMWDGNSLEQDYNYLVYEFETEQHRYSARAYLDEIHTVAVYGPFEKDSDSHHPLKNVEIDRRVLAYLRRRYAEITKLTPAGYVPIE
jgi:hypothetical protein